LEEQLKQRLVGGAVLVSLVVIFVPMLLDRPAETDHAISISEIPEKPKVLQRRLESRAILPEPISQEKSEAPTTASVEPPQEVKPTGEKHSGKIERPSPSAWMVQVASFSKRENAQKLVERLQEADLPAQLKEVRIDGKRRYRVQMPPQVNKKEAEKIVERIKSEFKLTPSLVRYSG